MEGNSRSCWGGGSSESPGYWPEVSHTITSSTPGHDSCAVNVRLVFVQNSEDGTTGELIIKWREYGKSTEC